MELRQISGLARPVDTHYPTNRWIAGIAVAVLAAAWLWRGLATDAWLAAGGWAALAALALFLAWALARELDPDRELAAFGAAGVMLPVLAAAGLDWTPLPDLAALFLLLLALRTLNRTTGLGALPADGLGVLGLGLWLALSGQPLFLAAGVAALLLDGLLPPRSLRRVLGAAAAGAVAAGIVVAAAPALPAPAPEPLPLLAALVLAALFTPSILGAGRLASVGDEPGEPLSPVRVRAAQVLALATALAASAWTGADGLAALLPLWAAMAAVGVSRLVRR
jgi:hypothetical protein